MIRFIFSLLFFFTGASTALAADFLDVIYRYCQDGNTCVFRVPEAHPIFGENLMVRIAGINVPAMTGTCEREQTLAEKARDIAHDMLTNARTIDLLDAQRGRFFRYVARVRADGVDIGQTLIDRGLAVPFAGGKPSDGWCQSNHPKNIV